MKPVDIIVKKKFGGELTRAEIEAFVRGCLDGSFEDYQLSALLMAICIQGMTDRETADLTMAMADSGDRLSLSQIDGVTVDKHSTGGVGDTTTLIAAPLAAACGCKVAKMSGRGLGYTGGTLDKLESIPGLRTDLDADAFMRQVNRVGLAVIGQSERLAPADRTLYALRDVTGTVRSLPLIASSIISKKIAAGCESVVLDVKTGSGALMPTHEESLHLARLMVRIGGMTGRRFSALLTDMSQPLGAQVGNALEVEEAVQILRGERGGALLDVSLALAESMILSGGLKSRSEEAAEAVRAALESGSGLEKLRAMIEAQGGDPRVVDDTGRLPRGDILTDVPAWEDGYIGRIEPQDVGNAARSLGAGRYRKTDVIDPGVGVIVNKRVGESVVRGEPVFTVVSRRGSDMAEAMRLLERSVTVSPEAPAPIPLIHEHIGPDDCAG